MDITEPVSLLELASEHLTLARQSPQGRSSHTIHGGREHQLRQTIIAMVADTQLAEHESPGEATLHVLEGKVSMGGIDRTWEASIGDHVAIPDERHDLTALTDAVVLLTVVKQAHV